MKTIEEKIIDAFHQIRDEGSRKVETSYEDAFDEITIKGYRVGEMIRLDIIRKIK